MMMSGKACSSTASVLTITKRESITMSYKSLKREDSIPHNMFQVMASRISAFLVIELQSSRKPKTL